MVQPWIINHRKTLTTMPILHWLDRDTHTKTAEAVPYRLLVADDVHSGGNFAASENMLIQGDNLEAVKALLPYYAGRVKCIFIDPPYNTKSAFEHYDDNLEHSQWLAMMFPRLRLLRELLAEDGRIWVTIDDNEAHYLKVVMDEVFGRKNFIADICWKSRDSISNDLIISMNHNHILTYGKNERMIFSKRRDFRLEKTNTGFSNPDNDPRGSYKLNPVDGPGGAKKGNPFYEFLGVEGYYRYSKETMQEMYGQGLIVKRSKTLAKKYFLTDAEQNGGSTTTTWWDDCHTATHAKKEVIAIYGSDNVFDTPKPEKLMQRILTLATSESDLVLDSFLGSGTTAAVAHKMKRRYIGIEMGDHAITHCVPRLQKVIEGEQGGISEAVGWQGGGGFRFYRLGEPVFTAEGAIHSEIRFAHLAAHIWFAETRHALHGVADNALIGVHAGVAYYLLYNGILGDKRPDGGNVLTHKVLHALQPHVGEKIIYGEASRISHGRLKDFGIIFKQTPYDVKAR